MAAITVASGFDLPTLHRHVAAHLPDYARPLFLRLCPALDMTGTFKPIKAALAREGFDPRSVPDALYYDDRERGGFVPLDAALHARIRGGEVRL